jgi:hypothetical protein
VTKNQHSLIALSLRERAKGNIVKEACDIEFFCCGVIFFLSLCGLPRIACSEENEPDRSALRGLAEI